LKRLRNRKKGKEIRHPDPWIRLQRTHLQVDSWLMYESDHENYRRQYATWFYAEEGRGNSKSLVDLEHLL